jgi:hypothetical protein
MAKTLLRPAPEPLEADDVAIVTRGTVLWFAGFLLLLPFRAQLADADRGLWPWICLAGAGLGLIGIWYCRSRRAAIARARARVGAPGTAEAGPTPPGA